MQSSSLFGVIEDVLVGHPVFGNSAYIQNEFDIRCMRHLQVAADHFGSARKLLIGLQGADPIRRHRLLQNTVVRCAVQHAHTQITTNSQYGLSLADCDKIFKHSDRCIQSENGGTPLESGKNRISSIGVDLQYDWIWGEEHPNDVFRESFRYLIKQNYGDAPCTLDRDQVAALARGTRLLLDLLPSLASSALSHVHLICCFENFGNWKNTASSSQFRLGGTVFLSAQSLLNPWWVAEHLFHEALHQKLYEFRHGHSLLEPVPAKETVSVWSPWNPEKQKKANSWDTHRTLAAFHVYVHLALLSLIADCRASELEKEYGPRHGMTETRKAFDRARYLGEQLRQSCWKELGFAGKELVIWLMAILDALDPTPAPPGTYFHLIVDLYDNERRKVEAIVGLGEKTDSALRRKLSSCAKQEIDNTRKILLSINANEKLAQFDDAVREQMDACSVTEFSDIRRLVIDTLLTMSVNGYELPKGPTEGQDPNHLFRRMVRQSSESLDVIFANLPDAVAAAKQRAEVLGFTKSCVDPVGRLLSSLAASVPEGGRILEVGTGVGVGTAWISTGLGPRTDVEVISIEINPQLSEAARSWQWPGYVQIMNADAIDLIKESDEFDLVFFDAAPYKFDYIEDGIRLLKQGGFIVVDDLKPTWNGEANARKDALRLLLLHHRNLQAVELEWSSGVILASALRTAPSD
jgi:predicted O-methyltransferase YrrM